MKQKGVKIGDLSIFAKKRIMSKRKRNITIISILIALMIAGIIIGNIYQLFWGQPFQISGTEYIYIDKDDNIDSVYTKIIDTGRPKSMKGFKILAEQKEYDKHIKTGRYAIKASDNMRYLHRRLSLGYQTPVNLTIGSVRTTDRLARNIGKQLMIDSTEIMELLTDTVYLNKLGYTIETIPALFIPNTYEVYWNTNANDLMERMIKEHKAFWNEERLKKAKNIGLSPNEVATLASIVEEETSVNAEKPIVAGLYINRLKKGMLLQADPTIKFSLQDFGLKRILFKHLEVNSPYNTYKHVGLPPGPIRIPSIQGLESVLNHSHHNYLYMCAKEDFSGTHNFATTSAQHAANARRYQQALNRRNIK